MFSKNALVAFVARRRSWTCPNQSFQATFPPEVGFAALKRRGQGSRLPGFGDSSGFGCGILGVAWDFRNLGLRVVQGLVICEFGYTRGSTALCTRVL